MSLMDQKSDYRDSNIFTAKVLSFLLFIFVICEVGSMLGHIVLR